MTNTDLSGLLKIGELAKAASTSVSTVKYYVKEGLVEIARKTGRNMAYYHPDSVRRVLLIKFLQKEKFYPLSVIKHLLENGEPGIPEIELYDAIHKVNRTTPYSHLNLAAAARETGLSRRQIETMQQEGLIASILWENKKVFLESDCRIMSLVKHREDAGIPFSQTLKSFKGYTQGLNSAAMADVDAIISDAIVPESPSTAEIVHMIRVSDETLDEFVSLKRYELTRLYGSRHIDDISRFSHQLKDFLSVVKDLLPLPDGAMLVSMCDGVLHGLSCKGDRAAAEAFREYRAVIGLSGEGLSESIAVCSKANHFFNSIDPATAPWPDSLVLHALRLGWLCLAPEVLQCKEQVHAAMVDFEHFAEGCGEDGRAFKSRIISVLR